jgi:hypothetical protein
MACKTKIHIGRSMHLCKVSDYKYSVPYHPHAGLGTADSTIPSPLPVPQLDKLHEHIAPQFPIPLSPSSFLNSNTLTELLNALPSRKGGFDSDSYTGETSPLSTRDYAPDSLFHDVLAENYPAEDGTDDTIVANTSSEKQESIKLILPPKPIKGFKNRIQNFYREWADRQDSDGPMPDNQEDFLKFVRDALSEL